MINHIIYTIVISPSMWKLQQLGSQKFLPLPQTHAKATLLHEPRIVQLQRLVRIDQFELRRRSTSAPVEKCVSV